MILTTETETFVNSNSGVHLFIRRIVTGVTLIKQNGIIHLAIAERNLLSYGQAEVISDPHSFYEPWRSSYEFFNTYDSDIEENIDFVRLTYENRSINLDDVIVPKDTLVTGVRFRITAMGHIALDVRSLIASISLPLQTNSTSF